MSIVTSSFNERFAATHQKSRELWERSLKVSRGIHHDARIALPFPIYASHARGTRKWDVDGNEYIDYTMGHGALMFGHAHPAFVEAVAQQVARSSHYGSEHESAIEWAELICQMIPAAERVEFCTTGTEADMLCAQLARAYTGRQKILKFSQHFFGWSDDLNVGTAPPYEKPLAGRLPPLFEDATSNGTVVIPINDREAMERALARKDIAALFIEGGGAHCGTVGIPSELVREARELTQQHGTLLVIDEVITGFRWSPGGYQATVGVVPDLCSMGKMVTGGLPGAAVGGRADVMELLQNKEGQDEWNRFRKIAHPGTFNGNPLGAVAGVTMLRMVESGEPQQTAERNARRLGEAVNEQFDRRGIDGCAYNTSSSLHLFIGQCHKCDRSICLDADKVAARGSALALGKHLQVHGVHFHRGSMAWLSAVHSDGDIRLTVEAFGRALDGMIEEGVISPA